MPRLSTVMRIPPQIEKLVASAVHPDPARRFESARAIANEIERAVSTDGLGGLTREVSQFLEQLLGAELSERRGKPRGIWKSPTARKPGALCPRIRATGERPRTPWPITTCRKAIRARPARPCAPNRELPADRSSWCCQRLTKQRAPNSRTRAPSGAARRRRPTSGCSATSGRDRSARRYERFTGPAIAAAWRRDAPGPPDLRGVLLVLSHGEAPAAMAHLSASAPAARAGAAHVVQPGRADSAEQEPLAPQPSVQTRAAAARPAQRTAAAALPRVEPELDRNRAPRPQVKTPRQSPEPKRRNSAKIRIADAGAARGYRPARCLPLLSKTCFAPSSPSCRRTSAGAAAGRVRLDANEAPPLLSSRARRAAALDDARGALPGRLRARAAAGHRRLVRRRESTRCWSGSARTRSSPCCSPRSTVRAGASRRPACSPPRRPSSCTG